MNPPDFKTCTEEQLWKYVAYHLSKEGLHTILVGGAVVSIYSEGKYKSGDLDFVHTYGQEKLIGSTMEKLGFIKSRGRHYRHPQCNHLFIEFCSPPVAIGDDHKISPNEVNFLGQRIRLYSPTDCIRDRLASYIHFNARECLDQAALVAMNHTFDREKVKKWCRNEGSPWVFDELLSKVQEKKD